MMGSIRHQYLNSLHLGKEEFTICDDDGVFSCNSFVCNPLCEVNGQKHGVLQVAASVGCFKKNLYAFSSLNKTGFGARTHGQYYQSSYLQDSLDSLNTVSGAL